jgi:regulator of protease activity HflC (stomatin/prohibitin superfamily)
MNGASARRFAGRARRGDTPSRVGRRILPRPAARAGPGVAGGPPTRTDMASEYPHLARALRRFGLIAAVFLIVVLMAAGCMTTSIGAGERGVKFDYFTGTEMQASYAEGFHVYLPWQRIISYNVRFIAETETIEALSSNGATIGMEVTVRHRPNPSLLPTLHQSYGQRYQEQLLLPVIRSAARSVVGQYTPEELYSTRRGELEARMAREVFERIGNELLEIEAVDIRDVRLPEQVRRAIDDKLQEEQRVQRAALEVRRAEQEAEFKRVEAQGDADRARIIAQSLSGPFLQFQGIQATRELAQSPNAKIVVIGNGDGGLPLILGGQ